MNNKKSPAEIGGLPRRMFLGTGAASLAGVLAGCAHHRTGDPAAPADRTASSQPAAAATGKIRIKAHRLLGRTGFLVSDIGLGCTRLEESAVLRHACDAGVNFIDTAERYGNGGAERALGEAMPHLQRSKLFIVTKLKLRPDETEQRVRDRFAACLERMRTSYADALYLHAVSDVKLVQHTGFHAAVKRLKADNKLRFAGISSHGPRHQGGDSMDRVLLAAAEDGRFDLMLMIYNFLNRAPGERVMAACKAKNLGVSLMKVTPAALRPLSYDPADPAPEHRRALRHFLRRGKTREQAVAELQRRLQHTRRKLQRNKPALDTFLARHGVRTRQQLQAASVQWALRNRDAHSVCISMADFDMVDRTVPLSGRPLSAAGAVFLRDYIAAHGPGHCRHGCTACGDACPAGVPVSTVMRYAYYFSQQDRQKQAMQKYLRLGSPDASACLDCDAPCRDACPHGLPIQAQLMAAHELLCLG